MNQKPFHERVAEQLIEQLKQGSAPWQRPWEPGNPGALIPTNPITQKRYKGINALHLMAQNFSDTRWMTYNQASSIDAQVRKGEKGTAIQYWKFSEERNKTNEMGQVVLDKEGKPVKIEIRLERPKVFYATIFNAEQIEGIQPLIHKEPTWDINARAELILKNSGAVLFHSQSNEAFYRPPTDSIHLPEKNQFLRQEQYYATALHELGHWTGHSSRLDRDLIHPFGSEGYAKEELRAEIASMILGDELGIGHDGGQHAAYVDSWIKVLQDDPLELFRAAAEAEKMQQFLLSFEQVHLHEQNTQQTMEPDYSQVLDVGLECIFNNPNHRFFNDEMLEINLRNKGINSVRDVTGIHPHRFDDIALDILSPIFQINLEDPEPFIDDDIYGVEGKPAGIFALGDLRDVFVAAAEKLVMEHDLQKNKNIIEIELEQPVEKVNFNPKTIEEGIGMLHATEILLSSKDKNDTLPLALITQEKIWLNIPFKQKETAKEMAGTLPNGQWAIGWDKESARWFAHPGADLDKIKPWLIRANDLNDALPTTSSIEKTRLFVSFEQREAVKQLAGTLPDGTKAVFWDKAQKSWFAHPGANLDKLKPWVTNNIMSQQEPALTPQQEFSVVLQNLGCIVTGEHPIMDGKTHRISIDGDKKSEKSGFYIAHLDGLPAGYIKNNRTGIEQKWRSKGYSLSTAQKDSLHAELVEKLKIREEEHRNNQKQAAERIQKKMLDLVPILTPTPYMQNKEINLQSGIFTDKEGQTTFIPATDEQGTIWTMQYINADGSKRFAKNSRKEGCFHVLGGLKALESAPALVISEGFATAFSVSEALGYVTVAAFDSGNLLSVACALHEKFPDKPIIITGDDDQHLQRTKGVNPGKAKAREAADAVNGIALFPIFLPGEQDLNPKNFSDYNDLATKSALGREGVERQVKSMVNIAIHRHKMSPVKQIKLSSLIQKSL